MSGASRAAGIAGGLLAVTTPITAVVVGNLTRRGRRFGTGWGIGAGLAQEVAGLGLVYWSMQIESAEAIAEAFTFGPGFNASGASGLPLGPASSTHSAQPGVHYPWTPRRY